jgi:uncharacterized cupin superfamily protein
VATKPPGTRAPQPLLTAEVIRGLPESVNVHQFNPNAVRHSRSLGDVVGMSHLGVHLVRLEQGHDSTQFHQHSCDEEFLYIISGRGIAEIGDAEYEVGAGDFMGFNTTAAAHNLRNPYAEDLVYLMAGERNAIDICDYPKIRRRMFRIDGAKQYAELDDLHDVAPTTQPTEK